MANVNLENEIIEDMLQWSSDRFYKTFGAWLETVVIRQKEVYQLKLKSIWRNRKKYAFRVNGEQFEDETMLLYFDSKKIKKYSLSEMESILDKIENETICGQDDSRALPEQSEAKAELLCDVLLTKK